LASVIGERADDGNFAFVKGVQEIVLGLNRGAAPAPRAVEFDDEMRPFFHLDIVDTIFQRMERVEATGAPPAQCLGGVENNLGNNLQEIIQHRGILDERRLVVQ
jgi:hypothetical protein